jgi:hypothetical protein
MILTYHFLPFFETPRYYDPRVLFDCFLFNLLYMIMSWSETAFDSLLSNSLLLVFVSISEI